MLSEANIELWSGPATEAHVALRRLLSARLGVTESALRFTRRRCPACGGPHGRPALEAPPAPAEFSLARADGLALVAVAPVAIGVDLEAVPDPETMQEVCRLLHPADRAAISALPFAARPGAFAQVWTRCEAYLKGIGTGIAAGLGELSLTGDTPAGWRMRDLPAPNGFRAALAVRSAD